MSRSRAVALAELCLNALGQRFLDRVRSAPDIVTGRERYLHPLLRSLDVDSSLNTGAEELVLGVAELVELGLYLEAFALDKEINRCLISLRDRGQYASTLFHLATAYRLHRAGCEIELEPETDRGRSDIRFVHGEDVFVGECYRINQHLTDRMGRFRFDLSNELLEAAPKDRRFRFRIRLASPLSNDSMRCLIREAKRLAAEILARQALRSIEIDCRGHSVAIDDLTSIDPDPDCPANSGRSIPLQYHGADFAACLSAIPETSILELRDAAVAPRRRLSRVFIWQDFSWSYDKDPLVTLQNKMKMKLKQTKISREGVGRVLFVEYPWGLKETQKSRWQCQQLGDDAKRKFESFSALVLLERHLSQRPRMGYRGLFLYSQDRFPSELVQALSQVERAPFAD